MDEAALDKSSARALAWLNAHGGDAAVTRETARSQMSRMEYRHRAFLMAQGVSYRVPMRIWLRLAKTGAVEFYDANRRIRAVDQTAARRATHARLHGCLTPEHHKFDAEAPDGVLIDPEDAFEARTYTARRRDVLKNLLESSFSDIELDFT